MTDNHIIFGTRAVMEALQAGRDIAKILIKIDRVTSSSANSTTSCAAG